MSIVFVIITRSVTTYEMCHELSHITVVLLQIGLNLRYGTIV